MPLTEDDLTAPPLTDRLSAVPPAVLVQADVLRFTSQAVRAGKRVHRRRRTVGLGPPLVAVLAVSGVVVPATRQPQPQAVLGSE